MTTTFNSRVQMKRDTTAHWTALRDFIPLAGEIIVYTDRFTEEDGESNIICHPGIKVGDGLAYLVDLPFIDDYQVSQLSSTLRDHINNTDIHTTALEKETWNQKISCSLDSETLILTCD